MTDRARKSVTYMEDTDVVAFLDQVAAAEGLDRSDILRRATRQYRDSVPVVSTDASYPPKEGAKAAAA